MSRSKKGVIAAVVGGLLAVGVVWWLSPVPVPGMHSAADAAAQIAASDPIEQREAARRYGALVAKTSDWESVADRGEVLPTYVQDAYFSAVAYSDFLVGVSTKEALAQIQAHVPEAHQLIFCNGLARVYTASNAASPDDVLAFVDSLGGVCAGVDLTDGLRIGVQEAVGENLGEAFAVIETYPPDLHDAMVEELGWRFGEDQGLQAEAWKSAAYVIPDHNLCSLACGFTLGAMHRALANAEPWAEGFEALHAAVPGRCREAAIEGLADALIFVIGPHDASLEEMIVTVTHTGIQQQIKEQVAVRLMLHEARARTSAGGDRIAQLPAAQHRHAAYGLGFLSGMAQDLEGIGVLGETLSAELLPAFKEGVSDGLHPDIEHPEDWWATVTSALPAAYQAACMDALIRAYTEAHAETPDDVLAFVARVVGLLPGHDGSGGVYVGLQQALGGDMAKAIAVAQTYPEALRAAMIEELGWRRGADVGLQPGAWTEVVGELTAEQACIFGAGMVRGAVLQTLPQGLNWSDSYGVFADALPAQCRAALDQSVAQTLWVALGTDKDVLEAEVMGLPQPDRIKAALKLIVAPESPAAP